MSRQEKLALSLINGQGKLPPSRAVRNGLTGSVISLHGDTTQYSQICIHVTDYKDELLVHVRLFQNGCPTPVGVAFDHEGWKNLMEMMPTLDYFVRHGKKTALFAFDSERSVVILNAGDPNVQVIFQREDKHVTLSYHQWIVLMKKQDCIKRKIIEHMACLIEKLEALC